MNGKFYKVPVGLKDRVDAILTRRNQRHSMIEKDGLIYLEGDITGDQFHRAVVRAKMEDFQEKIHSEVPLIAPEEALDMSVISEVGTNFIIKVPGNYEKPYAE